MKNPIFYAVALTATAAVTAIPCGAYAQETPSATTAQTPMAEQAIAPKAGDTIFDNTGTSIGPVESVTAQQFVMASAAGKATLPINALAMGTNGLTINMTKAQFEAAVTAANAGKTKS